MAKCPSFLDNDGNKGSFEISGMRHGENAVICRRVVSSLSMTSHREFIWPPPVPSTPRAGRRPLRNEPSLQVLTAHLPSCHHMSVQGRETLSTVTRAP